MALEANKYNAKKKKNTDFPPMKKIKTCINLETPNVKYTKQKSMDSGMESSSTISSGSNSTVVDSSVPCLNKARKRSISKTFNEDHSWE